MVKWGLFLIIFLFLSTPIFAATSLEDINKTICSRFEDDLNKMAAIMDEVKRREGIVETRVAFGGVDTPVKNADYWITYAAEAVAFQRAQKYSSTSGLRSSLEILKSKILRAKAEIRKVL